MNKSVDDDFSDSNSSFASSSDSDQLERAEDLNAIGGVKGNIFKPLYRREHGGILIYDNEAVIPNQPVPAFD